MAMSKVPPDSDDLKRVNARIPTELYNHLVNTAQTKGESMAAYLSSVVKADADRMANNEQRLDDACKRLLESGNTETITAFDEALITAAIAEAKAKADTVSAQADIKLAEARRAKAQADKDELDVAAQALELARTAEYHNVRGDIDKTIAAGLTDIGLSDSAVQQVRSFAEARALERMAAVDRHYADWIGKLGPKKLEHQDAADVAPLKDEHFSPSGKRVLTPKQDQAVVETAPEKVEDTLEQAAPVIDETDATAVNAQENADMSATLQTEPEVAEQDVIEDAKQPEPVEDATPELADEPADLVPDTDEPEAQDLTDSIFESESDTPENPATDAVSVPAAPFGNTVVPEDNPLVAHENMNMLGGNQVPANPDYTAQPEKTDSLSEDASESQTMSDASQDSELSGMAPVADNEAPLADVSGKASEQALELDDTAEADASAAAYAHSIFGD